jgi:hypothetical protein
MEDSRGEPEKVLVFARFFRGGFDGLEWWTWKRRNQKKFKKIRVGSILPG